MNELTSIGKVDWNNSDLVNYLPQFYELYEQRPIEDNNGGMMSSHLFPMYFLLKKLNPKVIIESGVYKGQGTWFFNKILPQAKIFSIDINPHVRQLDINGVEYFDKDVFEYDWKKIIHEYDSSIDLANDCLLFFDDHQNAIMRLKHFLNIGFKNFVFEDNYPLDVCPDCYSLKKAFYDNEDSKWLKSNLDIYYEFPPIFSFEKTRWGELAEKYPTQPPLLNLIENEYQKIFYDERLTYTYICYSKFK